MFFYPLLIFFSADAEKARLFARAKKAVNDPRIKYNPHNTSNVGLYLKTLLAKGYDVDSTDPLCSHGSCGILTIRMCVAIECNIVNTQHSDAKGNSVSYISTLVAM